MDDESPTEADQPRSINPPPVVHINSADIARPWICLRTAVWFTPPLIGVAVVASSLAPYANRPTYPQALTWFLLLVIAMPWVQAVGSFGMWLWRRRAAQQVLAEGPMHIRTGCEALLQVYGGLVRLPIWRKPNRRECRRFGDELLAMGFESPVVLVENALSYKIEEIELTDRFGEPERLNNKPIWPSMPPLTLWALLLGYMGAMLFFGAGPDVWLGWMVGGVIACFGIHYLHSRGIGTDNPKAPVVGIGSLSDHRGRRWTVCDSCLLVIGTNPHLSITVEIAGPAGWMSWTFHGVDDAGFRLLWQRWLHPQPRPELG